MQVITATQDDLKGYQTAIKKTFGLLVPQFKTLNKFDNIGASLPVTQLAIHSSGVGLISASGGTAADGYLKLPHEVLSYNATRTDWLLNWDTTESGASVTVGIGDSTAGYMVTIANSGGNVVITMPSGATTTGALTGTVNLNISIATGNMGITCSVHILDFLSLATNNPLRVPVYEWAALTKNKLFHAYFKSNTTSSKITGFFHNMKNWDGDPLGQMLTRSMIVKGAGYWDEHDNMVILPTRSSTASPLKVLHFFHGRTLNAFSVIDITMTDNADTARTLLNAGYAIISTTGGSTTNGAGSGNDKDWWGNPRGTQLAAEVYEALAGSVTNTGKEYLIGWSMGGMSSSNYARVHADRIAGIFHSCPVLDAEESAANYPGDTTRQNLSIQGNTTLKQSIDIAYSAWYVSLVASNTTDPQTDGGTNWRQVAGPGCEPCLGFKNAIVATVTSAVTNTSSNIALTAIGTGLKIQAGDWIYFKYAGQLRQVYFTATGTSGAVSLNAPVTLAAGDQVSIVRGDKRPGYDYNWYNRGSGGTQWIAGTYGAGAFKRRNSAHPELDVRPHNPTRFVDVYAEASIPFLIMVGGDGTASGNDGILNNAPMFAFRDAVNALAPNLVTILVGSGGHVGAGTVSAIQTLNFFNSL